MIRSGQCKGQPAFIYVLPVSFITQYRSDYSLCLEPGRELSLSVEKDKTKTGRDENGRVVPVRYDRNYRQYFYPFSKTECVVCFSFFFFDEGVVS